MFKRSLVYIFAASLIICTACSSKPTQKAASSSAPVSSSESASSSSISSSSNAPDSSSAPAKAKVHESKDPKVIKLYTEASNYYTKKDYTSAVEKCDEALKIDPECYEAINIKGAAQYYATGDPQQGLPLLNKCIELNPNYEYAYFNKALIYKGEKDWDTSISLFNKVIELDPKNAWAYYGISTIYADRDMVKDSLEYLKKAIDIDPSIKQTAKEQSHYDRMRNNADFKALVK
jgi:tetratricopeptide (TPR) repeat protein